MRGMLYSRIGYDIGDIKRVVIRNDRTYDEKITCKIIHSITHKCVFLGEYTLWGSKWNSYWYICDFSDLNISGEYMIIAYCEDTELYASKPITIGNNVLLEKSFETVALKQMEQRESVAKNHSGWKDCGTDWREVTSIAPTIIGMCDFYVSNYEIMSFEEQQRYLHQIEVGCDHLCLLQDRAEQIGLKKGAVLHEIPKYAELILGDHALFVTAMAKASKTIIEYHFQKSGDYLNRAESTMELLLSDPPIRTDKFSFSNHGASDDFIPPREIMTKDLVMMLYGAFELFCNGIEKYKAVSYDLADKIISRQVKKEKPEGNYYGHFYTFESGNLTEKANTHHHVGMDTGSIFPHYIVPLIEMCDRFFDEPIVEKWKEAITNFTNGYLLPACKENPFLLIPMGYFEGHGILDFCGPWHGINVTYCFGAYLALKLEKITGNHELHDIAVSNLQWIAGLNCGITQECIDSCTMWSDYIGSNTAIPLSQIYGVGDEYVGIWSKIPGSFGNGFCTNIQFHLDTIPCKENDEPKYYGDEDWIPTVGGWLAALGELRINKQFNKKSIASQ